MVARHLDSVQRLGQVMEEPAQRPRHRLGFVVVVQTGQIAPARVAAHLDQPGAELDPEQQPARQPQRQHRGRDAVVAEEDRQEPGLQQQRFPAERIPRLPDVDDRQVQHPQRQPHQHRRPQRHQVGRAGDDGRRQCRTEPGDAREQPIGIAQMEDARGSPERLPGQKPWHRQYSVLADECPELQCGRDERDQVEGRDATLEHQPAQPVFGRRKPSHGRNSSDAGDYTNPLSSQPAGKPLANSSTSFVVARGSGRAWPRPKPPAPQAKSAPAVAHSRNGRRNRRPTPRVPRQLRPGQNQPARAQPDGGRLTPSLPVAQRVSQTKGRPGDHYTRPHRRSTPRRPAPRPRPSGPGVHGVRAGHPRACAGCAITPARPAAAATPIPPPGPPGTASWTRRSV